MRKSIRKSMIAVCGLACAVTAVCGVNGLISDVDVSATNTAPNINVTMKEGASLRIGEDDGQNGITYTVTMTKSEYETLMADVGDGKTYKEVEFGVLIAPYAYHRYKALDDETNLFGDAATETAAFYDWAEWTMQEGGTYGWTYTGDKVRIMHFTADSMYLENSTDTYYSYAGSIVNILDGTNTDGINNIATEFYGVGYVKVVKNSDSSVHYIFAEDNRNNVSPAYVAQRAVAESTTLKPSEISWLETNYLAKAPEAAKTTTYTVETYFEDENGEYILDDSKTSIVTDQTVGESVTITATEYDGYALNEEKTGSLTKTVYYNGKLCVKLYYDKGYVNETAILVDKANADGDYDLTSILSEEEAAFVAGKDNVTYKLTDASGNEETLTESTVTLGDLSNGVYTLKILSGERVLYTATQVDICNSTVFELIDETDLASNFEKVSTAQTGSFTIENATATELSGIGMTAEKGIKLPYEIGAVFARTRIANLIHTDAYYTTYFADRTLNYDYYFTGDAKTTEAGMTTYTVTWNGVWGDRDAFAIGKVGTLDISLSTFLNTTNDRKLLCVQDGGTIYDGEDSIAGTIYYSNFRLKKEVELYEETTITMFDKNEKAATAVAWSDLMSAAGAAHVAGYEDLTYTLTYQHTDAKIADYTTATVDVSNLSGLYVLAVATDDGTIYSGVVDIFNSTVFEFIDESIFVDSFAKYGSWTGNSYHSLTKATDEELTTIGFETGKATLKSTYSKGLINTKLAVSKLMHSTGYYTTYFGDKQLQYDMYMTFYVDGVEFTNDSGDNAVGVNNGIKYLGSSSLLSLRTKHTITVSLSEFLTTESSTEGYPLMRLAVGTAGSSRGTGEVYRGNFRLAD